MLAMKLLPPDEQKVRQNVHNVMSCFITSYTSENFDYFIGDKSVPVYEDPTTTKNRKQEVHKQTHSYTNIKIKAHRYICNVIIFKQNIIVYFKYGNLAKR